MPRRTEPLLGDDLVDAYRAVVAEVYDSLARDGFPDLPQAATTVFRDMDERGSYLADLAVRSGVPTEHVRDLIGTLAERGYVTVDGDVVTPAERGLQAFAAGREALRHAEQRLAQQVGPDRYATFRTVLRKLAQPTG
jgi:hypothetical protein